MKTLKKIFAVLLCALLVAAAFAGCTPSSDPDKGTENTELKVAILQYMPHSSLDNCTQGIKNALDKAGIKYDVQIGSSGSAYADCESYAAQMAAADYDLIIPVATPAALTAYAAVRNASKEIPIVFCAVSDPVEAKLVQSLDAPGNNCTGTADAFDIAGQVALIKQLQPEIKNLGVLYTDSEANSISQLRTLQAECDAAGITLIPQGIHEAAELAEAASVLITKVDAITNLTDNNVVDNMLVFLSQAEEAGVPVYGSEIEQVQKGCLASASLDYVALGEKTGEMAVDILKGANASEYAVVTVADSFVVINSDVAEKFGITVPAELSEATTLKTETAE